MQACAKEHLTEQQYQAAGERIEAVMEGPAGEPPPVEDEM
jgi:hypothetical protein